MDQPSVDRAVASVAITLTPELTDLVQTWLKVVNPALMVRVASYCSRRYPTPSLGDVVP